MRRRTLLATTGALLSAGCSEVLPDLQSTPTADSTTDTTTTTPPPTDTETEPPSDTPTETPTETETPTPDVEAADRLATAREHLSTALTTYTAGAGEDATLLGVTADSNVDPAAVSNPVRQARSTLSSLPSAATDRQRATARDLRTVGTFLVEAARCQSALHDVDDRYEFAVDRLYAENTASLGGKLSRLRDRRAAAAGHLATVESETTPESAAALPALGTDTYRGKRTQLRDSVAGYGTVAGVLPDVRTGFEVYEEATSDFEFEDYSNAIEGFGTVVDIFGDTADTLSSPSSVASLEPDTSRLATDIDRIVAAAEDFQTAAEDGNQGRPLPDEVVAEAQDHLRAASERCRGMDSTQTLLQQ